MSLKTTKKILILVLFFTSLYSLLFIKPSSQQVTASICPTSGTIVSDSLIQAGSQETGGKIYSTIGTCVIDPQASFVSYKIPTFEELKSVYYTQVKSSGTVNKHAPSSGTNFSQSDIPLAAGTDHLYYLPGNLTINAPLSGSTSGIIFIEGNLNITNNISYGTGTTGVVFIAKGNINIDIGVTLINAVLISEGTICTAYESSCPTSYTDPISTSQLVVNGSLISISPDTSNKKIILRRNIADNSKPAEQINQQSKYLIILKNLFTQTLTITTEDTNYSIGL